jgi:hypothetical protein
MLDLNHPQTKFVFAISREDDRILSIAKKMTLISTEQKREQLKLAGKHFENMRSIMREGWKESRTKELAIAELEKQLAELASTESSNEFLTDWQGKICTVCQTEITDLKGYADMVYCDQCLQTIDSGRRAVDKAFGLWLI